MSFSKEIALLRLMLRPGAGVAHFLNAENDFHYTGRWSRPLHWKTIGTFHFPPAKFGELFPDPSCLRRLDAAICVGSNQVRAVKELVQHDRVWSVPLGVDETFFRPAEPAGDPRDPICLFVGTHLRDFVTLRTVADLLGVRCPSARITAIMPARYAAQLGTHPRISVHTDVSDEDLRDWYQRAALLLLPLVDATATSSILEAMACGLPVVVTDVGGVRDYVSDACAIPTPPGDADAMTGAAMRILGDPALRRRMAAAARTRALEFAWPKVARAVQAIYDSAPSWSDGRSIS
jgi:glycosyltransferase involved in cell wall biosynthesis